MLQNCSSDLNTSFRRLDSRMLYGRQASASQGYFMRQAMSSTDKVCCFKISMCVRVCVVLPMFLTLSNYFYYVEPNFFSDIF